MSSCSRFPLKLFSKYKNIKRFNVASIATNKINHDSVYSDQTSTHFGYETVSEKKKAEKVHAVFENVSSKYDIMNDAMSMGVHRLWKDCFMQRLAPLRGTRLLDVAGGTGDIAFRFLNYINNSGDEINEKETSTYADIKNPLTESNVEEDYQTQVVVCDINEAMLEVGKERSTKLGFEKSISWVQGDAEKLPFSDNSFDVYTIAFGIRNVVHVDKALSEAYRVLKPGGRFLCLEFSHVNNPLIRSVYDLYSFQVIPVIGQLIAKDWKSYQYLVESIRQFPNQEMFKKMMGECGFKFVEYENLTFGITAIHSGFKI